MDLGEKLFELRKSKNLTQDEVAEVLNVARQTVSKWETNQSTPDFDKIVPLCELYGITPNELLMEKEEKKENPETEVAQAEENEKFDWNEAKKHLFTRGKDDEDDNYENMTRNQIKRKSAEVVSSSILIFIICIAYAGIATTVWHWDPTFVGCTWLIFVGWGIVRIVKHYMSIPKLEETKEEKKEKKLIKQIQDIIGCIGVVAYFIISFATMAWHITWIIFVIVGLVDEVVKLIFMLKGDEEDEK
ncbi:MAG: helix-turn-helix transcriptional regulator [Clostridia bacterium]|nr:helix-turn-helix transcriptional regulator [Clostridia bacterium]